MTCVIMREEGHKQMRRRPCDDRGRETGWWHHKPRDPWSPRKLAEARSASPPESLEERGPAHSWTFGFLASRMVRE